MHSDTQGREGLIDWSSCSWQGAREAHIKAFRGLCFQDKLQTLEEWCELSRSMIARRQRRGLPTIPLQTDDPATKSAQLGRTGTRRNPGPAPQTPNL